MFKLFSAIESFFHPASAPAERVTFDIQSTTNALLTILKTLAPNLMGAHVTKIVNDVASAAQTTLSNQDKLASVTAGVVAIAKDTGAEKLAAVAPVVAETVYQLVKLAGLLPKAAPTNA
jgi:hypothetical protein